MPLLHKLSTQPRTLSGNLATVSSQNLPAFDDLYEYYDPDAESEPQPERPIRTPVSQRRPPSSSSGSLRSLRRTPRLQEKNTSRLRPDILKPARIQRTRLERRDRRGSPGRDSSRVADLPFDRGESLVPQVFQRIFSHESPSPPPNPRISRQTHEAILFALEAIRSGDGRNYKELSSDIEEESARMSDLLSGDQPGVSNGSARPQNGGSRPAPRGAPVPAAGVRTPTEVMRARRERDARKKAQEEEAARLRDREQQELRRAQEAEAAGGIVGDTPARRKSTRRPDETQDPSRRTSGGQYSTRRQENAPPVAGPSRSRATTLGQSQPIPVTGTQRPKVPSRYEQPQTTESTAGPSKINPTNPLSSSIDEPANTRTQPQPAPQHQPQPSTQQSSGRSSFPNALERWETLSSYWEGLTSYWIRRLQENSNELNREPLNQQMSRQIIDLSAAGSNLFLAVFELQRLRASSDRKFQRWYFETSSELKRYQEQQAELERLLQVEREERARVVSSTGTAEAERLRAEELVKEMRRELQISKEEARRAWEELGRREQEERDRTISLRSGEPTLVGGVQVVPMTQGVPSRQTTIPQARPQTRDGPYPGGPSAGMMGGQTQPPASASHTTLESPDEEERQFSYQPPSAVSPANTDPFTEERARGTTQQPTVRTTERSRTPREDLEMYQRPSQPLTASAAIAALRISQAQAYPTIATSGELRGGYVSTTTSNGGGNGRFYQQGGTSAALQPPVSAGVDPSSALAPARPITRNTDPSSLGEPSYIPSTVSGDGSDDDGEYEIDPDGNYRRDAGGRRIPWLHPNDPAGEGSEDEYDVESEIEREREHAMRYGAGAMRQLQQQQQPQYSTSTPTAAGQGTLSPPPPVTRSSPFSQQHQQQQSTIPAPDPPPVDYSGQGYGAPAGSSSSWEAYIPRHLHPTRLSDIPEQEDERSRRTSPNPSRASWVSGTGAGGAGGGGQSEAGSAGTGVNVQQGGSAREMRERYAGGSGSGAGAR